MYVARLAKGFWYVEAGRGGRVVGKRVATVTVMGEVVDVAGGRGGVGAIVEPERRWVGKTLVCCRVGKEGRRVERSGREGAVGADIVS